MGGHFHPSTNIHSFSESPNDIYASTAPVVMYGSVKRDQITSKICHRLNCMCLILSYLFKRIIFVIYVYVLLFMKDSTQDHAVRFWVLVPLVFQTALLDNQNVCLL